MTCFAQKKGVAKYFNGSMCRKRQGKLSLSGSSSNSSAITSDLWHLSEPQFSHVSHLAGVR